MPMQLVNLPGIVKVEGHPNNAYASRQGFLHEGIVVHTMVGTLAGCDSWFANPAAQAGTHFGVGRNGEVHQYFDLAQGPFAHGRVEPGFTAKLVRDNGDANPNWYLIGIEHDDRGRPGTPEGLPTPKQLKASAELAAVLFRDHILPHAATTGAVIDRDHILRHADISPQSRGHCPGWPRDMFLEYIERVRQVAIQKAADARRWLRVAEEARQIAQNAEALRIAATGQNAGAAQTALANIQTAAQNALSRLP